MPEFVRVASVGEMFPGEMKTVEVNGRQIVLANVGGEIVAFGNECTHRGGPLGDGDLDGRAVTCPWHAWRWDVTTGANVNNPAVRVACFPVAVENGAVYVDMG